MTVDITHVLGGNGDFVVEPPSDQAEQRASGVGCDEFFLQRRTDMVKKLGSPQSFTNRMRLSLLSLFLTSKRAAQSSIYLAASPEVEQLTGKYVNHRKKIVHSSPASYDEDTAEMIWQISAELTGLEQKSLSLS